MSSFVTFVLYAAATTAAVLIATYFTGTTTTCDPGSDRSNQPFPARRIRGSV